jgi:hypothetical protein
MIYVIKFSDSMQRVPSRKELEELAVLWEGEIKDGNIITEFYPEDYCDSREHFPVFAPWKEYKGDYSQIEPWIIPVPTSEEYITAVLGGEAGEAAKKGLLNEQATWEMVEFIPAHKEWKEEWSHSRGSSDGYRSSSGRSTVSRYQAKIPDTWVWVSSTGMRQELTTENHRPQFKTKYDIDWYCQFVKNNYLSAYAERKTAWEATNIVKIKKVGKPPKTEKASEPAKHPLSKKSAAYPDLKKYFYGVYPELQEYENYIQLSMWPGLHATFELRKNGIHYEQVESSDKYIYKFDEDKKVDEILLPAQEALDRAKAFKTYADAKSAEGLAKAEAKKAQQQKERDYETYKKTQQAKKGLVKSFEKWLATVS